MRVSGLGSEAGQVVDMACMAEDLTRVCVLGDRGSRVSSLEKIYTGQG